MGVGAGAALALRVRGVALVVDAFRFVTFSSITSATSSAAAFLMRCARAAVEALALRERVVVAAGLAGALVVCVCVAIRAA